MSFTLFSCSDRTDYYAGFNVAIDAITIIAFPESNNDIDWDKESDPDITFKIANEDGYIFYTCDSTIPIIHKEELPVLIDIKNEYLTQVNHTYSIALYEIDDSISTIVGKPVLFNPQDLLDSYKNDRNVDELPKTKRLENEYITIKVHLSWDDTSKL